ncbi:MAG: SAM-dependent methyltransferase [Lachnospiraceae bacterium]|nr:SAM-dependent methyltransferase [Lachnospiraceae bacterium]
MVLSDRLMAVSMMVTEGHRLADIGTDHAFVPIFLAESGRIPCAIAMDVNTGPLERARANIISHALEDRIHTRLSDGLSALGSDEADTVLIAGMGGGLCVRILGMRDNLCHEVKELVLQPQSEIEAVRRYLERSGWMITNERIVFEDGKYYTVMRCVPGRMTLTDIQARYGPVLLRERSEVWTEFLDWRKRVLEKNLSALNRSGTERGAARRVEVLKELEELETLLSA